MTLGVSTVNMADKWLNVLRNTSFTGIASVYVKLHTGDPGASGTTNASAETTRKEITWSGAPSSGVLTMTGTLSWASWTAGTSTISHVSLWDAATAGNFLWSGELSIPRVVTDTDTFNITALTCSVTPKAA